MRKITINKATLKNLLNQGLRRMQVAERLGVSAQEVLDREMKRNGLSFPRYCGGGITSKKETTRGKISKTVSCLWENGYYQNRIDGMLGIKGYDHPRYQGQKWHFAAYLKDYQNTEVCAECSKVNTKIDIHHIDGDHENWLITNLIPLCVFCHQKRHTSRRKTPAVSLAVIGHFDAAHNLLDYQGACARLHGHRWNYEIEIKGNIADNGFVIDFKELKQKLKDTIDELVDHSYINAVVPFNPSAENLTVWLFEVLQKRALIKGITKITLWEAPDCKVFITSTDMLLFYKQNKNDKEVSI